MAMGCADSPTAPKAAPRPLTVFSYWSLDRIDQASLPLSGTAYYGAQRGNGVRIYVIDTGVDILHPEFEGRATLGPDFTGGNGEDCYGHGTGTAALAAGATTGVAPEASIISVRVFDCSSGTTEQMIQAMDWIRVNSIHPAVAVIAIGAWGIPDDPLVAATAALIASGVPVVAASGNDAGNACLRVPGATPEALTISATAATDAVWAASNVGSCVDLWAPGVDVTTAYHNFAYAPTQTGTSFSAPLVAGAAAVVLSEHPTWTSSEVNAAIVGAATPNALTSVPSGTVNLLLRTAASVPPPAHNAGFTAVCVGLSCTFTAAEVGQWRIGLYIAKYGQLIQHTFPSGNQKWAVTHTVIGNVVTDTVRCRKNGCS
jgi:Subtilisin-like serine proteases